MSVLIERSIETGVKLIADGKTYPLRYLSVKFRASVEGLSLILGSDNPIPASAKTLILQIPGMDTHIPVLREECEPSLEPADEHFHLIVPDPIHREMIAKLVLADESHPK
ncbi:MAG TPA: hypothetical protein VIK28_10470 [Sedimentisphaerales bacterium]